MHRRAFLAATAAAAAGCNQSGSGSQTETGTEQTPSDSATLAEFSAPNTVQIDTTFSLRVTVENDGKQEATYESPLSARIGTGEWESMNRSVAVTVPAGESVTETVELEPHEYVQPAAYRLEESDAVARTRFVTRMLGYGGGYTMPNGIAIAVRDLAFSETYTYEGSSGETTVAAGTGRSGPSWPFGPKTPPTPPPNRRASTR